MKTEELKQIILLSKTRFCHVPELYEEELTFVKLNSFSEQLRFEMMNNTKLSETAKEYLNKGMNLPENVEVEIWQTILNSIDNSKNNVLPLGSSIKFKLVCNLLKTQNKYHQLKCINLELEDDEFKRRCELTLRKGKELNSESILSFLEKYKTQELERRQEIAEIEQNTSVNFERVKAELYEKEIISKQIGNCL